MKSPLLLAYYGDDFTGSTDALEFLSRAGARTALFLAPPTEAVLSRYPDLQAMGIAGLTRSLAPKAMAAELREAFGALRAFGPRHVHYKVCSTFDSSPTVGSIGCAIDVGAEIFRGRYVPLLVAAPELGRYCVFGNLFARMGIGSAGEIFRLDRHPSMSQHPVTPADEADLRRHLARQTRKRIDLLDVLHVSGLPGLARAELRALVASGAEIVLFDALDTQELPLIGSMIDEQPFSVGSSAVEMALGAHWNGEQILRKPEGWPDPGPATPLLVVSGSCSPVTAGQIAWAEANGFAIILFDPPGSGVPEAANLAVAELKAGRSAVVCSSRGAAGEPKAAKVLGALLGQVARAALERTGARRLVLAGGDTASYASRALGIEAVEMIAPLAPGAPLCRAFAPGSPADGLEINFKGGQVGAPDFFGAVARGKVRLTPPS